MMTSVGGYLPERVVTNQDLSATVAQAHAELNAVLHRMDIPIADLKKLTPGDVLSVPAQSIAKQHSTRWY